MPSDTTAITATKNWLNRFIIQHNICPFAKREFDRESIHYEVSSNADMVGKLETLIRCCEKLDSNSKIETCLLMYPQGLDQFDDYLDFLELANTLMYEQGYEGIYQLASFHPDYAFEGVDRDDASNYTNRSPYPMLHIIREASLEKVLENYPDPEGIPERNIEYTRNLGTNELKRILSACKADT